MIIDGHSHVTLPLEQHIEEMDRCGVDRTVLFSTSIHPETATTVEEIRNEMAELGKILSGQKSQTEARTRALQELLQAVRSYPDRYIGFGNVPIGMTQEETDRYIEKNIVGNGLAGMGEFTLASGSVAKLTPIFRSSTGFGSLPIWIHAFHPLHLKDIQDIAELAARHPSVPVIIGHLGGFFWMETLDLVKTIPNLYLDTSAYYSTLVLKIAIHELPEKCLFGVDRPYGDLELALEAFRKLCGDEAIARAVMGENMLGILNR
ncbi:amidohydrolase family protein [Gorillibacterium timonense]|uniref:amidohydrolase family protein n=1 Tax=Gorillibacterium timonense TaxID=1689269 RepID=UPI00071D9936|nr:amidohydrolase family protein [Gorillibacterium timonense]